MNRLKELINELNISQTRFADDIGMTKSNVSKLVKGDIKLTPSNIKLICIQYGVSENWLRTGEGEMFDESYKDDFDYLAGKFGDKLTPNIKSLITYLLTMDGEQRDMFERILDDYIEVETKKRMQE